MNTTPIIRIFVACHKPTYVPKNRLLTPVQVGAALGTERFAGMQGDDQGAEHISEKNAQYCEMTAQYWVWKHVECDYYGFFHYRRYMSFRDVYPVMENGKLAEKKRKCPYIELDSIHDDLSEYKLEATWMEQQIWQYDLITVLRERINTSVYRQFCQYHAQAYLDEVLTILKTKYPAYEKAAETYMHSKEIYYMNMYIMKKELFQAYMKWLFDILQEFENTYVNQQQEKEPRLMGYLAERLFGIFYIYQREHGAKCAEVPYLKFYHTALDEQTKPENHIRIFRLKPTKFQVKIDMRKLNRMFPAGTRRRILLRSIFMR